MLRECEYGCINTRSPFALPQYRHFFVSPGLYQRRFRCHPRLAHIGIHQCKTQYLRIAFRMTLYAAPVSRVVYREGDGVSEIWGV